MIFTTNKPLSEWGRVLHDEDLAAAILDRILERGRLIHLDGPSGRTRHLNLEAVLPAKSERVRISGIDGSEFPEPTRAHSLYLTRNHAKRGQLLKSVLLNCATDGVSLTPTYRKPFDLIFQRTKNEESSALADDFRTLALNDDAFTSNIWK
jgi:IstB-like ATP binding protein